MAAAVRSVVTLDSAAAVATSNPQHQQHATVQPRFSAIDVGQHSTTFRRDDVLVGSTASTDTIEGRSLYADCSGPRIRSTNDNTRSDEEVDDIEGMCTFIFMLCSRQS